MTRLVLVVLCSVVGIASVGRAGTITVHFSGHITEIDPGDYDVLPPLSVGDPFLGSYSYDDTVEASPESSQSYRFDESHPISLALTLGDTSYSLDGNPFWYDESPYYSAIALGEGLPDPYFKIYSVFVVMGTGPNPIFAGIQVMGADLDEPPESRIVGDAAVPALPPGGGDFSFAAHPSVLISPERFVPGVEPGGFPVYAIVGGQRVQIATHFPAVRSKASVVRGDLTSLVVPEASRGLTVVLVLGALALRRSLCASSAPVTSCAAGAG